MPGEGSTFILCYGRTSFTPGRYLEDGFRQAGLDVVAHEGVVDFSRLDTGRCRAVIFIESPSRPSVRVLNLDQVEAPKFFWVHHGRNRLAANLRLCARYRPDLVLLSASLDLAESFPARVHPFPFAMAAGLFDSDRPWSERRIDIAFVGSHLGEIYRSRRRGLRALAACFGGDRRLSLRSRVYLRDLAALYADSRIVYNRCADGLEHLTMRVMEGMGCGALVVTDAAPGQEALFTSGEHLVTYSTVTDLVEKVAYYLAHPDEAQAIATAGRNLLLRAHTYAHRALEIARLAGEAPP